jgi:5-methylcytosine-specific restriction endonuclease McrA
MSQYSASGRPYKRLQAQVFAEEARCWLCGDHVDQRLPANDDMARSLDHVMPVSLGGNPLARTNARLAHRRCNSSRKAGTRNPQSRNWTGAG